MNNTTANYARLICQVKLTAKFLSMIITRPRVMPSSFILMMLTTIFMLTSCAIFDTKNPESPLDELVVEDPFNISFILSIATESAVSMDYRDYFTDDVVFEDSHLRRFSGRSEIVNMLNRLRARNATVIWDTRLAHSYPAPGGGVTVIEDVPYTVYSGGRSICAGIADFRVSRGPDWRISFWKDMPNDGETPFFEP